MRLPPTYKNELGETHMARVIKRGEPLAIYAGAFSLSLTHQASLPLRSCTHTTLLLQVSYFARPTPTHEPGAHAPLLLLPQLLGADLAPAPACSLVYGYMNRTYIYGLDCWTSASSLSLLSLLASKMSSMTDGPGPGCSS